MTDKYKLILVAGARPNFMKIAPLMHTLQDHKIIEPILVHTGQHYDAAMSDLFFEQLNIPKPFTNLGVGSSSHAVQTANIMMKFEEVCNEINPNMVMVVGDVNSTAACVLTASKLNIPTAHYEAGLRSNDRTMPEEINRVVTDAIVDYFFTTSVDADENLIKEGKEPSRIFMVGNLMIDTLVENLPKIRMTEMVFNLVNKERTIQLGLDFHAKEYCIMTFHRPNNVDEKLKLEELIDIWETMSHEIPLIFPIHPRTYKNIVDFGLLDKINSIENLFLIDPLGYLQFINLIENAKFALTDSGGIQEETTYLNIPCLTVRPNTERPITLWEGTNKLISSDDIIQETRLILSGHGKTGKKPKYWDGNTAKRIVSIIEQRIILK